MKLLISILLFCCCLATSKYRVVNVQQLSYGYNVRLNYTGNDTYYVKPTSPIIKQLNLTIRCHTALDLSFKITDLNKTRFQVPQGGLFPQDPAGNFTFPIANSQFHVSITHQPFDMTITRKFDNQVLFNSHYGQLIFSDHYIQISTPVASTYIYGLGQRFNKRLRLTQGTFTIWNRDPGQVIDMNYNNHTYGFYPVYLVRQQSGNYHVNYFRSSNAMDIIVKSAPNNTFSLTYKVIGGVIDFRFFLSQRNPQAAIEKFQSYMGRSTVPPFWSFGFHQCRWGYKNITYLENVIEGYEKNGIPLDIVWSDIDYMSGYEDFTIDETRFPLDRMANITKNYRWIPIIDAGIGIKSYAFEEGQRQNVFLKNAQGNATYIGTVWPGQTGFVDFFQPNASAFWGSMLDRLYSKVKFSGIWLDMNEVANFCDGGCNSSSTTKIFDYSQDLPYFPGGMNIEKMTISLNATHYGNLSQANVHAYFGFLESAATHKFFTGKNQRPFIITRSSTLGSNKFAFHWTGDSFSNFNFLKSSISDIFLFQIWGIQMVGGDICGFAGNVTEQLCSRWFQLGSFYPFARNHNINDSISQEAYAMGPVVMKAAKTNLKLRYSLLKSYYRNFINRRGAGTIFRPVFTVIPEDINLFRDDIAQSQFMIGSELMLTPILVENTTFRNVYFPARHHWYDYHTGRLYKGETEAAIQNNLTDPIPIFIRNGTGVVFQNTENVTRTSQLNNLFKIKAGFTFNERNSTGTKKVYESRVNLLSIQDFNDQAKIASCLTNGCDYTLHLTLETQHGGRTLYIDVSHTGPKTSREEQLVDGFQLFYEDGTIVYNLKPLSIIDTARLIIPLPDSQNHSLRSMVDMLI